MKDETTASEKAFIDSQVENMATKLTGLSPDDATAIARLIVNEATRSGRMDRALGYVEGSLPMFKAQFQPGSAKSRMVDFLLDIIAEARSKEPA